MVWMMLFPILLTIGPAVLYQLWMLLHKRISSANHYLWTYLLMLYIWMVLSITGIGSVWDVAAKGGLGSTLRQARVNLIPFQSDGVFTYCMNVVMLMPLGFLLPHIWKKYRSLPKVALFGLLFSGFIEFAQLPTNRLVDIDDLLMNTLGAVLGFVVWRMIGSRIFSKKQEARSKSLGDAEAAVYVISACICNFLLYNWRWFL